MMLKRWIALRKEKANKKTGTKYFAQAFREYQARYIRQDPKLGAKPTVDALTNRLYQSLLPQMEDQTVFDPVVVGLYGEWGAGKSFWLESIRDQMLRQYSAQAPIAVVPVLFNAWRYEKEDHLIIPLIKSAANELEKWAEFCGPSANKIHEFVDTLGVSAYALSYGLAEQLSKDVLKLDVFKALEKAQKIAEDKRKNNAGDYAVTVEKNLKESLKSTKALESRYFEFQSTMENLLTQKIGEQKNQLIRFLFLIDDLDRCLPEKSIELLESIKLFLDVQGTAFVLAVDDEIVERGITHRYRDYIFQGPAERGSMSFEPISGHEYLEKFVTLPVRISRPSQDSVLNFIQSGGHCVPLKQLREACKKAGAEWCAVFDKLMRCIPPVPRKLIRLSELFNLRCNVLGVDKDEVVGQLMLLRVVALQLFAPEAYRCAQKYWPRILPQLIEWKESDVYGEAWPNVTSILALRLKLEAEFESNNRSLDTPEMRIMQNSSDRKNWDQYFKPILHALSKSQKQRSGFNPVDLLEDWDSSVRFNWPRMFGVIDNRNKTSLLLLENKKEESSLPHESSANLGRDLFPDDDFIMPEEAPAMPSETVSGISVPSPSPSPSPSRSVAELDPNTFENVVRNFQTTSRTAWEDARQPFLENQTLDEKGVKYLIKGLEENLPSFSTQDRQEWLHLNGHILNTEDLAQVKSILATDIPR